MLCAVKVVSFLKKQHRDAFCLVVLSNTCYTGAPRAAPESRCRYQVWYQVPVAISGVGIELDIEL